MIIRNGMVYQDGRFSKKDVFIDNGRFSSHADSSVIDASGRYVLPGLIDAHVHMREPGDYYKEDWDSGSRAAVSSGITFVLDMPNNRVPISTIQLLEEKRKIASAKSKCRFGLFMLASDMNIDEVNRSSAAFVKLYHGKTTGDNTADTERIFRDLRRDILIAVHAEDNRIMEENKTRFSESDIRYHSLVRDNKAEYTAVFDLIALAEKYRRRLHICHVSTKEAALLIKQAKNRGAKITCETCPHYLLLDDSLYGKLGKMANVNPGLKSSADREALWRFVNDGTIDIITSDHAPHSLEEKKAGASGFPGLETTVPLMLTCVNQARLSLERFTEMMTRRPADIFGLDKVGRIEEGCLADLTIIDLVAEGKIAESRSKAGWSPFIGTHTKGKSIMTIINGEIIEEV